MPEEPDSEIDPKEYALETPGYMLDGLLVRLSARDYKDERGFVTWDAQPHKEESRLEHFELFTRHCSSPRPTSQTSGCWSAAAA